MPQMRGMASRSLPDSGVRLRAYRDSARWVAAGWASRTEPPPPAGSHAAVCGRGGEPRRAGKVWSGSAAVASRSIETWRWGRDRGADGVWGRLGWFIWFGAWFVWASLVPDNLYPVFHTNNTNAIFFFYIQVPNFISRLAQWCHELPGELQTRGGDQSICRTNPGPPSPSSGPDHEHKNYRTEEHTRKQCYQTLT
jgi:hypothetical protein